MGHSKDGSNRQVHTTNSHQDKPGKVSYSNNIYESSRKLKNKNKKLHKKNIQEEINTELKLIK